MFSLIIWFRPAGRFCKLWVVGNSVKLINLEIQFKSTDNFNSLDPSPYNKNNSNVLQTAKFMLPPFPFYFISTLQFDVFSDPPSLMTFNVNGPKIKKGPLFEFHMWLVCFRLSSLAILRHPQGWPLVFVSDCPSTYYIPKCGPLSLFQIVHPHTTSPRMAPCLCFRLSIYVLHPQGWPLVFVSDCPSTYYIPKDGVFVSNCPSTYYIPKDVLFVSDCPVWSHTTSPRMGPCLHTRSISACCPTLTTLRPLGNILMQT